MRENADQNNSEYGRFLRSESSKIILAEMYSPLNEHLFFWNKDNFSARRVMSNSSLP